jgi:NodT family efflux transporter outer membrane factor (OMF) lipoprotein
MIRRITAAFLLSACAACAHPPAYTVPSAPEAPAFKESDQWKVASPGDAAVRGDWWELFGDAQLTRLEQQIDVSNQSLKSAEARFTEARASVRIARAALYPTVTAVPTATAVEPSGNRAISTFHSVYGDVLLPIDASYEVDAWGRVHGVVNASLAQAQASAADLETIRLSLHAELAADYFALQGLDREKELLDQAVANYDQALQLTNNRFQGGIASQADVALAETQLETTRALAVDEDVQRAALEHAIAVLVGAPASTFSLARRPIAAEPAAVPPTLPSTLLERRPDIAAAERRVAAASAQVGVTRAAWYPVISLSGAAGVESSSFGKLLSATSTLWSIGPSALVTLFDSGRRHAVTAQAQAAYDEAVANYRETVLTAFRDVEDQLSTLNILATESDIQQRAVAAAERSLEQANNRYRGGLASYLEVTAAQTAALTNERTAVSIDIRRVSASVQLLKAVGGGWSTAAPAGN